MNEKLRAYVAAWLTAIGLCARFSSAHAYESKASKSGDVVRWAAHDVDMVVDARFDQVVPGGAGAIAGSVGVWNGIAGGPTLTARIAEVTARPGYDGQNCIVYAPEGFAPAGDALAVTVLSFDDLSGRILDADVVVNGEHAFTLFDDGARPRTGAHWFAMDTGDAHSNAHDRGEDHDDGDGAPVFDLRHVVGHELGHVLGLSDEPKVASALMYPFTYAHDASRLRPADDDIAGITAIYPADYGADYGAGCSAGGRARSLERASAVSLLIPAVWVLLLVHRRVRRSGTRLATWLVVGALPLAGAWETAVARAPAIHEVDTQVRIEKASTVDDRGLFRTTLRGRTVRCGRGACSAEIVIEMWGGRIEGIEQRVGGRRVPREGEVVNVALPDPAGRSSTSNGDSLHTTPGGAGASISQGPGVPFTQRRASSSPV